MYMVYFWLLVIALTLSYFVNNVQVLLNDSANNELDHGNPLGTRSAEMIDNNEIDSALDEFSRMLSNYDNPADQAAPTAAQKRLEALFAPPNQTDNLSDHLPAAGHCPSTSDTTASAAKGNPGASAVPAEDEESVR